MGDVSPPPTNGDDPMDPTGGWALWTLLLLVFVILVLWVLLPTGWAIGITIALCLITLFALGAVFSSANYH